MEENPDEFNHFKTPRLICLDMIVLRYDFSLAHYETCPKVVIMSSFQSTLTWHYFKVNPVITNPFITKYSYCTLYLLRIHNE